MNLARPDLLWWMLALLAGLAVFLVWAWRVKQRLLTQFVQARLLEVLTASVARNRQKARLVIIFLGVACVAVALARPQWGMAWEETKQRGLDIVVAIDTSRSMLATDLAPNRLARAKLAALDLMREAKSDRLGLVAFAGSAFLQCPLTLDEEAFRQSIHALDTTIIPQGGSALSEAVTAALTAFEKEENNFKVLVLFTDGEDHEAGAIEAAKEAAKAGLRIFTVGVGTADGELLRVTGESGQSTFLKDDQGNAVKSRLNETLLREIATAANGFYLPLRGANVVETLYERGLAPLPKGDISTKFVRRFHERFQWPLALGIILLTMEMFISDRKKSVARKAAFENASSVAKAAVTAVLLAGCCVAVEASPSGAKRDFQAGRFKEAQEEYSRLAEKKPNDPRLHYNAGTAAYRAGAYDDATEHFTAALRAEDVALQQQAYYNLGNTLYRAGDSQSELQQKMAAWEQAVQHYDAALKLKADDADAKFNHELLKQKLEELKKQQQQQQQQNQDDKKDKQDEKKDDQPKQDQQQKQDQQKKDQKDQEGKDQPSPKQDGEKKDSQKDQPKAKDQADQKQKEDAKSDQQSKEMQSGGKEKDDKNKGQQGTKPENEEAAQGQTGTAIGMMDMQQALQLLDAQKGDVKALIFRPADPGKARPKTLKDW